MQLSYGAEMEAYGDQAAAANHPFFKIHLLSIQTVCDSIINN